MDKKRVFKYCTDKTDAIAAACELGLDYHLLKDKAVWLVCSDEDWKRVISGDIIIC